MAPAPHSTPELHVDGTMTILMRPSLVTKARSPYSLLRRSKLLRSALQRRYATHNTVSSGRKAITLAGDDGRVPWRELSVGEKVIRSTQQSFNFSIIIVGIIATAGAGWFLFKDVLSTDSKTHHFNEAHRRIKTDPRCVELLGDPKKIWADGGTRRWTWAKDPFIVGKIEKDRLGAEHLIMQFPVFGPKAKGWVKLHMTKEKDQKKFEYRYLALDVEGHQRIWLENKDAQDVDGRKSGRMFGVRWW